MLSKCLDNAVKKEKEIPNIILECLKIITGKSSEKPIKKNMRSAEEIMKDYGILKEV